VYVLPERRNVDEVFGMRVREPSPAR
jgi:hypothetical protein